MALVPASREASLPGYQDFGVLLILRRKGLCIVEVPAPMQPRTIGPSKIFRSRLVVGKYLLQTSLLCITRIGYHTGSPDDN